jgi:hypothetical protein
MLTSGHQWASLASIGGFAGAVPRSNCDYTSYRISGVLLGSTFVRYPAVCEAKLKNSSLPRND